VRGLILELHDGTAENMNWAELPHEQFHDFFADYCHAIDKRPGVLGELEP
jgi:hypothetical protein